MGQSLSWEATSTYPGKKFSAFYGTADFITVFTKARHLPLSGARSLQFIHFTSVFKIHFNIILPSVSRSCMCSFFLMFSPKKLCTFPRVHTCYMSSPSHLHLITWIILGVQDKSSSSSFRSFLQSHVTSYISGTNTLLSTTLSGTHSLCSSLNVTDQFCHPYNVWY